MSSIACSILYPASSAAWTLLPGVFDLGGSAWVDVVLAAAGRGLPPSLTIKALSRSRGLLYRIVLPGHVCHPIFPEAMERFDDGSFLRLLHEGTLGQGLLI